MFYLMLLVSNPVHACSLNFSLLSYSVCYVFTGKLIVVSCGIHGHPNIIGHSDVDWWDPRSIVAKYLLDEYQAMSYTHVMGEATDRVRLPFCYFQFYAL